jgi:proline racemase
LEPRGHADMYGGFLTPPDDAGADLGVLFWHKDGFSTACGHGTIALGAWAIETGRVQPAADGATEVTIDVPSGRVVARVHTQAGRVSAVDFVNVASYLLARDVEVATPRGIVRVDIGFGGAIYAQLRADAVGLAVVPEQLHELLAIGREVKWLLHDSAHAQHPSDDRLSGIYGTVVFDELGTTADGSLHQRNVTIFADGQVDRSPCGSGSAARLAVLDARGELGPSMPCMAYKRSLHAPSHEDHAYSRASWCGSLGRCLSEARVSTPTGDRDLHGCWAACRR